MKAAGGTFEFILHRRSKEQRRAKRALNVRVLRRARLPMRVPYASRDARVNQNSPLFAEPTSLECLVKLISVLNVP